MGVPALDVVAVAGPLGEALEVVVEPLDVAVGEAVDEQAEAHDWALPAVGVTHEPANSGKILRFAKDEVSQQQTLVSRQEEQLV